MDDVTKLSSSSDPPREKSFYSSLGLLIILNAIIKPLWIFGIDRQVQNIVGTEEYGIYFSLLNFSIVFSFILDWGLTGYMNRQLATSQAGAVIKTGNILLVKIVLSLAYVLVMVVAGWISRIQHWDLVAMLTGVQVLTSFFIFLRNIFTAKQWFKTDAWLSVLDKFLMILLCGTIIYAPGISGAIDLYRFLWVQLICTAVAVSIGLFIITLKSVKINAVEKLSSYPIIFRQALPYAMIVLLMSAHYRLDGFLLERIHTNGASEAGLYAGAYRLLDAANMIGYLLASFLLPYVAYRWSQGKNINQVVLNSRHLLAVFSIFIICICLFLAPWIQELLYKRNDDKAIEILQWCLPVLIGYTFIHIYGTVLTAAGHIVSFCRLAFFAVLINVTLNLFLIPSLGARGCCLAAWISHGFLGIATMHQAIKKTKLVIHYPSLLMYIFIAVITGLLLWWGNQEGINALVLIFGSLLVTGILGVAGKIFDPRKLKKTFLDRTE